MTQGTPAFLKLSRQDPLHPAVVVAGVLLIAATAKLGHGPWGIGGLLAFYPSYLAMLTVWRSAALAVSQLLMPPLAARRAYAGARVRR